MTHSCIEKRDISNCCSCGEYFVGNQSFVYGMPLIGGNNRKTITYLYPLCLNCGHYDLAESEADSENRRYTAIGVCISANTNVWGSMRCGCGAVTHAELGFCVRCWRESRMLKKVDAENKILHRMLVELRREIKTQKRLAEPVTAE